VTIRGDGVDGDGYCPLSPSAIRVPMCTTSVSCVHDPWHRLRAAGAVILGKANLGEWANFRGFNPLGFSGWTARGGATRNPYLLSYSAFGSSSRSAVGPAANLCAAAVGTETDGSIFGPRMRTWSWDSNRRSA
jgi:hypothetical protein